MGPHLKIMYKLNSQKRIIITIIIIIIILLFFFFSFCEATTAVCVHNNSSGNSRDRENSQLQRSTVMWASVQTRNSKPAAANAMEIYLDGT